MQKDFHFYVIAILAKHAGYNDDEAIVIATASQYVDSATESFPIQLNDGRIIETTMTAHYHLKAFSPSVQKKVYMCFHFPPEGIIKIDDKSVFSYKTQRNSKLITELLKQILADKQQGKYSDLIGNHNIKFHLYRLGIALHTLADSWSHESFTCRLNAENDVGKIWFQKGTTWKRQYINDWKWDIGPAIGHLECGPYPDQPFRRMQYGLYDTDSKKFKILTRKNPNHFKKAAKTCLEWLNTFNNNINRDLTCWDKNSPAMKCINLLIKTKKEDSADRIHALKTDSIFIQHFGTLFENNNDYTPNRWRDEALLLRELNDPWGEIRRRDLLHAHPKPEFEHSSFRLFHKAAKLQRTFILDKLFW